MILGRVFIFSESGHPLPGQIPMLAMVSKELESDSSHMSIVKGRIVNLAVSNFDAV